MLRQCEGQLTWVVMCVVAVFKAVGLKSADLGGYVCCVSVQGCGAEVS